MTVGPKTKSIYLQVAFKAAIETLNADPSLTEYSVDQVAALTGAYYEEVLVKLGEQYGAGDEPKSSGGWSNRGGGGGAPKPDLKAGLPHVKVDYFGNGTQVEFVDQRSLKQKNGGPYKDTAADYQSVEKFDLGDGKGSRNIPIWLEFNGSPTQNAALFANAQPVAEQEAPF